MRNKWLYHVIALVMLLTVGVTAAQDTNQVTIIGGDESELRRFITYLTKSPFGKDVTITVGQLPQTLPFTLPVAEDGSIIGSVNPTLFGKIQIWLHSPQPTQAVIDFYTEQLTEAGWTTTSLDYSIASENEDAAITTSRAFFCAEELAVSLELYAQKQETGDTIITVYIDQDYAETFCVVDPLNKSRETMPNTLLPPLVSLPGVTVRYKASCDARGGAVTPSAVMSVILITEMAAGEVRPLYDRQLEADDWHQVAAGSDDGIAWSTWTFQDEAGREWYGILNLTQMSPVSTEYFAMIYIEEMVVDSP